MFLLKNSLIFFDKNVPDEPYEKSRTGSSRGFLSALTGSELRLVSP